MLKSKLVSSIHKKYPSLNPNEIELISNLFFKKIILALQEGKKIEIRGFGTLAKKVNKAKFVRNPKTNERIYKDETYKVHFKIGKILHNRINSQK
jgi:integration host factor subunit beta